MSLTLLFTVLNFGICFACDSNCYNCHQNIPDDKEHGVLITCTNCHPEHSEAAFGDKCGADCFECHSISKVTHSGVKEHEVLNRCIGCHSKLKDSEVNDIYKGLLGG